MFYKISNKYRFITPTIIEVELTKDQTFIVNSKFIEQIDKYNLSARYDKTTKKYYVMYVESPKHVKPFANLISGFSMCGYINGCTLDLRMENLRECDNSVIILDTNNYIFNDDGYPYNKWILGKYAGTVFQRAEQDKWSIVVTKDDGSVVRG